MQNLNKVHDLFTILLSLWLYLWITQFKRQLACNRINSHASQIRAFNRAVSLPMFVGHSLSHCLLYILSFDRFLQGNLGYSKLWCNVHCTQETIMDSWSELLLFLVLSHVVGHSHFFICYISVDTFYKAILETVNYCAL